MPRRLVILLLALSFCSTLAYASSGQDTQLPYQIAPAQLHKEMGAAKAHALGRMRLGLYQNLVVGQSFDATYYSLDLKIDHVAQQVAGHVTMYARSTVPGFFQPTLNLLDPLLVDSVQSGGVNIPYTFSGGFINATLPVAYDVGQTFEMTVFYHGHPTVGGFQGFEFGTHSGVPMISTLSEPYLAQSWWPCKDTPSDKADSVDTRTTVSSSFYVVSNGTLRDSIDNGNGTTTYSWHESYPITTYLVSLAITNYARFDRWYHYGADSMPVRFYSYPELLSGAQSSWPVCVDQIGLYASLFGEYPFVREKYGIAHFTWGGAMEHQTASSFTSSTFGFDQYVVTHELAHQWWGDMVTCRDWHHIWLNEGFASYCEALWAEHLGGTAGYKNYMAGMTYLQGGRIYIDDTTNVNNIFDSRVYDKGAWVLHMLRGIIGDSAFFATMRAYYSDPARQYKDAVTEDFRDIAEAVSGRDLTWFFQDWIYGYYYPKYMASFVSEPREDGRFNVNIHLRQYQSTLPQVFRMPVPLQLRNATLSDTVVLWNDQREQDYLVVMDFSPTSAVVDPANWILDVSSTEPYAIHVFTDSLLPSHQYLPYSDSIVAKCGNPGTPVTFTLLSGSFPSGITLDGVTGKISGTPEDAGDRPITVLCSATGFSNVTKSYTFRAIPAPYYPGDLTNDGTVDVQDVVAIIDYAFRGGPLPTPANSADLNGDCVGDLSDVVILITYAFRGGPRPGFGCIQ
jgi:hypothetical protein